MQFKARLRPTALSLALFCALLGWAPKAHAQAALFVLIFGDKIASESFHLSIDGGLNLTYLADIHGGAIAPGINFGMGGHLKLSDRWSFVPEFKPLGMRGLKDVVSPIALPPEYAGTAPKSMLRLNYLDVPLLLQYRFIDNFYVSAGPQVSFLLGATQSTDVTLQSGTLVTASQDVGDKINSIDVSVPVEVGYVFANVLLGKAMHLRVRYSYGFLNVLKTDGSAHNSMFQVIVSFPFIKQSEPATPPATVPEPTAPPATPG